MTKRSTYIAGDIMTRGSQLQRAEERAKLEAAGIAVYNPQDNKSINDKQNAVQEGLAERIVREDMERLFSATDIVIEPQPHAQGTLVELGIIYGAKVLAENVIEYINDAEFSDDLTLATIKRILREITDIKIYPHNSDIRRTDMPEVGDRRSFSINQFVYGVVLALTDGHGFYDFDEAVTEIKKNAEPPMPRNYNELYPKLAENETDELNELTAEFERIMSKVACHEKLTPSEDVWLQTRPHYISTGNVGLDIVDGELIELPADGVEAIY